MGNKGSRAKRHKPTAAEVALAKEVVYFGDANKDGKLSMDEAMAVLKEIDTDGDGNISADELAAAVADLVIAAGGGVDDVTALKAEIAKRDKEIAKHIKDNAKQAKDNAKQAKEIEKTKPLKAELAALKAELQAIRSNVIPKGVKTFQKAKFYDSWKMFSTIFPRTLALEMDGHAQKIMAMAEEVRTEMLIPLLFDKSKWHPEVEGGGLHWGWDLFEDGFREDYLLMITEDGTQVHMPGFDDIPYATLRQPMADKFKAMQTEAEKLVAVVQGLSGKVYELIPQPAAKLDPVSNASRGQPVPAEYRGLSFAESEDSPEAVQACEDAIALIKQHIDNGTLATKLYIADAEAAFLIDYLASGKGNPWYCHPLLATMVLHSESFHARLDACLGSLANIKHANMKTSDRADAKTEADYMERPKPEFQWVKDFLRLTAVVDNHRILEQAVAKLAANFPIVELKVRLEEETHDVLAVIEFEDELLCEVQFTFASVQLMKIFSHAAYNIARIELAAGSGLREMINLNYTVPMRVSARAGQYESRSKDEIQLKLAL